METHFVKQITQFSNDLFKRDIQENLRPEDLFQNDQIHPIVCNIFNSQAPFMNDLLSKEIIKRSNK